MSVIVIPTSEIVGVLRECFRAVLASHDFVVCSDASKLSDERFAQLLEELARNAATHIHALALEDDDPRLELAKLAKKIGEHWRDQEGVHVSLLDELAELAGPDRERLDRDDAKVNYIEACNELGNPGGRRR